MGDLPPYLVEVAPNTFEGPARKVGPNAYAGRLRVVLGVPTAPNHDCDAVACRRKVGSAPGSVTYTRETRPR